MIWFEDVEIGATRETAAKRVSAEEIVAFAAEFDPQYFHLDAEAAKDSMFGGLVASGWHTCAMMMRLMVDGFITRAASIGSPGFDDLVWLKPVRPGDVIRARSTPIEKTPSRSRPEIGSVKFRTELLNQHDEVVLRVTQIGLYRRRPPQS